jgi:hypothetical protein
MNQNSWISRFNQKHQKLIEQQQLFEDLIEQRITYNDQKSFTVCSVESLPIQNNQDEIAITTNNLLDFLNEVLLSSFPSQSQKQTKMVNSSEKLPKEDFSSIFQNIFSILTKNEQINQFLSVNSNDKLKIPHSTEFCAKQTINSANLILTENAKKEIEMIEKAFNQRKQQTKEIEVVLESINKEKNNIRFEQVVESALLDKGYNLQYIQNEDIPDKTIVRIYPSNQSNSHVQSLQIIIMLICIISPESLMQMSIEDRQKLLTLFIETSIID